MTWKKNLKKFYHFLVHDNSIWSWIVNIILAFIIVKFIIFPGMGLILSTDLPMVAVVSCSMEHNIGDEDCSMGHLSFDDWWEQEQSWYLENGIDKSAFESFKMKNGFNKGDVIILHGKDEVEVGDIVVYDSGAHTYPIIHRVTLINEGENTVVVKGDNNDSPDPYDVNLDGIRGTALYKIPYVGWVKIWFTSLIGG
tara:strand:+ start:1797 stop:2384 length:588 start_codon:yes stop_codon:yes gene_type:complete